MAEVQSSARLEAEQLGLALAEAGEACARGSQVADCCVLECVHVCVCVVCVCLSVCVWSVCGLHAGRAGGAGSCWPPSGRSAQRWRTRYAHVRTCAVALAVTVCVCVCGWVRACVMAK